MRFAVRYSSFMTKTQSSIHVLKHLVLSILTTLALEWEQETRKRCFGPQYIVVLFSQRVSDEYANHIPHPIRKPKYTKVKVRSTQDK